HPVVEARIGDDHARREPKREGMDGLSDRFHGRRVTKVGPEVKHGRRVARGGGVRANRRNFSRPPSPYHEYINSGIVSWLRLITSGATLLGITMNSKLGTPSSALRSVVPKTPTTSMKQSEISIQSGIQFAGCA